MSAGVFEHGRQGIVRAAREVRSACKECGGGCICEHGRQRSQCKECGGASICEHGRVRSKCKESGWASREHAGGSEARQGVRGHGLLRAREGAKQVQGVRLLRFCEHGRRGASARSAARPATRRLGRAPPSNPHLRSWSSAAAETWRTRGEVQPDVRQGLFKRHRRCSARGHRLHRRVGVSCQEYVRRIRRPRAPSRASFVPAVTHRVVPLPTPPDPLVSITASSHRAGRRRCEGGVPRELLRACVRFRTPAAGAAATFCKY